MGCKVDLGTESMLRPRVRDHRSERSSRSMTDEGTGKRSQERKELDRPLDIKGAIENIQGHPRYSEGKQACSRTKRGEVHE